MPAAFEPITRQCSGRIDNIVGKWYYFIIYNYGNNGLKDTDFGKNA